MGIIRLFLAIVVVVDHFRLSVLGQAHDIGDVTLGVNAGYAVMFFYIISGFLISMVLDKKYPETAAGAGAFYWSRLVRIFSLYWPIAGIACLIYPGYYGLFEARGLADKITNIFLFGMSWRIVLVDMPGQHWDAALTPFNHTWTLDVELTFYLIAPFLLRSPRWVIAAAALSLIIRAYFIERMGGGLWTYMLLPSTLIFFLIGHGAYRFTRQPFLSGRCGCVLLIVAVLLLNYPANADWDSPRFWVTALCFAFALPGIFAATAKNRLSNWLGDLSYPLYLIHLLVMAIMLNTGFFRDLDSPITAATTYTASCFVAAAVARYLLEAPTAYALQAFRDCVKIGSNLALERLVRAR